MRKEKIILSFLAVLVGIAVAILAFFFYQSTKDIRSSEIKKITISSPTPSEEKGAFLNLDQPKDESVVQNRTLKISGKTEPDANIVIVTEGSEQGALADKDGNFSTEITLSSGENIIQVTSLSPKGESVKLTRVVTYSTESF